MRTELSEQPRVNPKIFTKKKNEKQYVRMLENRAMRRADPSIRQIKNGVATKRWI